LGIEHALMMQTAQSRQGDHLAIMTLSLNPALDLSTDVETVESGTKLRCNQPRFDPGGGGINVSRAIAKLGGSSIPFAAVGGPAGEKLKELLAAERLEGQWFPLKEATRQSVSIYERSTGKQFRFVMPGPELSETEQQDLLSTLKSRLTERGERIGYLVASGSLPPGVPDDFYHVIKSLAHEAGARFVLDTSGRALTAALRDDTAAPHIWVMDHGEAEEAIGAEIVGLDALEEAAAVLARRSLADILVVSYGDGGAIVTSATERHRIVPPRVEVLSKVGAGDSFVAGLTLKLSRGATLREAAAYAVAAATSAVTTAATQLCDGPQTEEFFRMIMAGQT
jgi:6-phosphofructokinase 2